MFTAASVNWSHLLILIGPSLLVLAIMGLTWRSRVRRQREQEQQKAKPPRSSGASRSGSRSKRRRK